MWGTVLAHPSAILLVVQLIGVLVIRSWRRPAPEPLCSNIRGSRAGTGNLVGSGVAGPTWIAVTLAVVASGYAIVDAINPTWRWMWHLRYAMRSSTSGQRAA